MDWEGGGGYAVATLLGRGRGWIGTCCVLGGGVSLPTPTPSCEGGCVCGRITPTLALHPSIPGGGVVVAGGSDAPVETPTPLLGMHCAITREGHGRATACPPVLGGEGGGGGFRV